MAELRATDDPNIRRPAPGSDLWQFSGIEGRRDRSLRGEIGREVAMCGGVRATYDRNIKPSER